MKRITILCGQGSKSYGERLTYLQMVEVLKDRDIKADFPVTFREALKSVIFSDGVIFAGRRVVEKTDPLDVLSVALEFGKPIFFFGVSLGEMRKEGLKRFSTILMSSLVKGFLTDPSSTRWAKFWAGERIKMGTDISHVYLLEHFEREKSKFAVFAPRFNGSLRKYKELRWLPALDARIIVTSPEDSRAAVDVSENLKTEDVVVVSRLEDIMEVISNAKFVISERFHVSLTAESFGVPFIHVGRRAMRYFGNKFERNFSQPDEVEMALSFSKITDEIPSYYAEFNERVKKKFEEMLKSLNDFFVRL
ncbi:polysaccharide pyruvyl transferase family protein [Mesoaciditoga sp.]